MVEVIIPYAGDCRDRSRALTWILERYHARHADWTITVATGPDDAWCKARAVMPAISSSCADVVVVADADVWTDGLTLAVEAVHSGHGWAMPHGPVFRLTQDATSRVLTGAPWHGAETCEPAYNGVEGGGIIAAHRSTLLDVPMDPRFVGWGQEDTSHAVALRMLHGPPWRGAAPLIHLYHPPQPRMTRTRGSREGWLLFKRYLRARRDPALMLELLEEARRDLEHAQAALPDHPPQRV